MYVAVGGVFVLDDLYLPLATICEIFNESPLYVEDVPDRPDEVRFVMSGFMLWVKDVVVYGLRVVRVL